MNVNVSALEENTVEPALLAIFTEPLTVNDPLRLDDPVTVNPFVAVNEPRRASEPLTMTFFQFGLVFTFLLWLDTYTYAVYMPTSFRPTVCL